MEKKPKKNFKTEVVGTLCKGCGYCAETCPKNVFEPAGELNSQGYDYMTAPRTADCIGCTTCLMICPDFAIRITEL